MFKRSHYYLSLVLGLLVAGCGSDPGFDERTAFERKEGSAQFVNMISDSPQLTVLHGINQNQVEFGVATAIELRFEDKYNWEIGYRNNGGDFVTVKEGDDQQVTENFTSVFLMMGTTSQPLVQVVDREVVPLADRPTDSADVWFAANLANHSMIDVYLTSFGDDLAASSPFASVNSGSFTSLFTIPATNAQQLRITAAGTLDLLFDSGSINIPAQNTFLFAAVDDFGPDNGNHVNVILSGSAIGGVMEDVSQPSAVRVANLSSSASPDVSMGSATYPAVTATRTGYTELAGGSQPYTVTLNGVTAESQDATLLPGHFHSVYVFDAAADATDVTASLLTSDDLRSVVGRAQFLFVNGNQSSIDFYALREGADREDVAPVFGNIGFAATATTEVLTGNLRFQVTGANDNTLLTSINVTMEPGKMYTIIYDSAGELSILTD